MPIQRGLKFSGLALLVLALFLMPHSARAQSGHTTIYWSGEKVGPGQNGDNNTNAGLNGVGGSLLIPNSSGNNGSVALSSDQAAYLNSQGIYEGSNTYVTLQTNNGPITAVWDDTTGGTNPQTGAPITDTYDLYTGTSANENMDDLQVTGVSGASGPGAGGLGTPVQAAGGAGGGAIAGGGAGGAGGAGGGGGGAASNVGCTGAYANLGTIAQQNYYNYQQKKLAAAQSAYQQFPLVSTATIAQCKQTITTAVENLSGAMSSLSSPSAVEKALLTAVQSAITSAVNGIINQVCSAAASDINTASGDITNLTNIASLTQCVGIPSLNAGLPSIPSLSLCPLFNSLTGLGGAGSLSYSTPAYGYQSFIGSH